MFWPYPAVRPLFVAAVAMACACSDPAATEDVADNGSAVGEDVDDTTGGGAKDTGATTNDGGGVKLDVDDPGKPDTGCVKVCLGKICGPNGCGGVCGFCATGQFCAKDGSKCQEYCKPDCTTLDGAVKKCGPDGCGGSCGKCPKAYTCGIDFLCHAADCKPDCKLAAGGAKKCGDNGCGGLCGTCAEGDLCDASGTCKPGPCKGIPAQGVCDGSILKTCKGNGVTAQKVLVDCAAQGGGPNKICGWDPGNNVFACIDKPPCTADCSLKDGGKKQCGSDGCDGKCGVCPKGWSCPGGLCKPEDGGDCGFLPAQGKCDGNVWIFCNTGKIKKYDCGKVGQKCMYDSAIAKFTCK